MSEQQQNSNLNTILCDGQDGPFQIVLQNTKLCVVSIPTESVSSVAWLLFRQYTNVYERDKNSFNSFLLDDDGLSLVCTPTSLVALQALNPTGMIVSQQRWIALVINVCGEADFPGAVYHLANSLSSAEISILHISTFEAEVFLVQEQDIDKAVVVMKSTENPAEIQKLKQISNLRHQKKSGSFDHLQSIMFEIESNNDSSPISRHASDFSLSSLVTEVGSIAHHSVGSPVIVGAETVCESSSAGQPQSPYREGFRLCVLPRRVILAKFASEEALMRCSSILINLLLYDERYSFLERKFRIEAGVSTSNSTVDSSTGSSSEGDSDSPRFMLGIWCFQEELTVLLEEGDIDLFPEDCLVVSPQRWRVVKLCGRTIEFDETGIVSAMSRIDNDIPSLHISTANTNCTLVPEELLSETLLSISDALKCPYFIPTD